MINDPKAEGIFLAGAAPFAIAAMPEDVLRLPTIAVDGGIDAVPQAVLWIGDGDSGHAPQNIPAGFKTDQNKTDLAYALDVIQAWEWRQLHLAGFWGGRFDHALAVLGTLQADIKKRKQTQRVTLYTPLGHVGAIILPAGRHDVDITGAFSVLAIEPAMLTLGGACDYKAEDLRLSPLSGRGVSNNGQGGVHISADAPVMIIYPGPV